MTDLLTNTAKALNPHHTGNPLDAIAQALHIDYTKPAEQTVPSFRAGVGESAQSDATGGADGRGASSGAASAVPGDVAHSSHTRAANVPLTREDSEGPCA